MPVIYKTLFEIRLHHEFYLTRSDGTTIFEELNPQDRETFLADEFMEDRDSVNDDIRFEFPQSLQSTYESSFLKLIPSYSGCRVTVRVKPKKLADKTLVFEPFVPLTNGLHIFILVQRKNSALDNYTNVRIKRNLPSIYFFSNSDSPGAKTFPFLTNSIPVQDSSFAYEQGELSLSGAAIQEFYRQGGADTFRNVAGRGFVN